MIYVLYHANCPDGLWSAYAVKHVYKPNDVIKYIPVKYNEPPPEMETEAGIYILDFSYPRETIIELQNKHRFVIVIDHHKTAEKELEGLRDCIFDLNHSGAYLSWQYFNGVIPEVIGYVEDRDLWKWELPFSREVNAALSLKVNSFEDCTYWVNRPIMELVAIGKIVLEYQQTLINRALNNHDLFTTIDGHNIPVINSCMLQSELGEALNKLYPDTPFSGVFVNNMLNERTWSLRSKKPDVDCGAIAKKFGGGGHPGAAGFKEKV